MQIQKKKLFQQVNLIVRMDNFLITQLVVLPMIQIIIKFKIVKDFAVLVHFFKS